ncbi:MAG: hypothetical protein AB7S26_22095 [Sandaracinaceae bacterium]
MTREAIVLALALGLSACGGTTYAVAGEAPATGADATIEVSESDNSQRVSIHVSHLPPPDRVAPGMTRYSVWIIPTGLSPVLAGTLRYDAGEREGAIDVLTPHETFEVIVTAQNDPLPLAPSDVVVLREYISS